MRQLCYGRLTTSYAHNHQTSRIPMPGDPPEFAPHPPSTPIGWRLDSSTPPLLVSLVSNEFAANSREFARKFAALPPPTRPPPPPPPPLAGSSTPPPGLDPSFQRICGKFAPDNFGASPPHPPSTRHPHSLLHPHWLAARLQGRPPLTSGLPLFSSEFAANSREFAKFASPPHPPSTHPHSLLHPHWLAARLQGRPPLLPPFWSPLFSSNKFAASQIRQPSSPSLHPPPLPPPPPLAGGQAPGSDLPPSRLPTFYLPQILPPPLAGGQAPQPRHPGSAAPPPALPVSCCEFAANSLGKRICGKFQPSSHPPSTHPTPTPSSTPVGWRPG